MNEKTSYEIMKNREVLKAKDKAYASAEQTDQEKKLPFVPRLQTLKGTKTIYLPTD